MKLLLLYTFFLFVPFFGTSVKNKRAAQPVCNEEKSFKIVPSSLLISIN